MCRCTKCNRAALFHTTDSLWLLLIQNMSDETLSETQGGCFLLVQWFAELSRVSQRWFHHRYNVLNRCWWGSDSSPTEAHWRPDVGVSLLCHLYKLPHIWYDAAHTQKNITKCQTNLIQQLLVSPVVVLNQNKTRQLDALLLRGCCAVFDIVLYFYDI